MNWNRKLRVDKILALCPSALSASGNAHKHSNLLTDASSAAAALHQVLLLHSSPVKLFFSSPESAKNANAISRLKSQKADEAHCGAEKFDNGTCRRGSSSLSKITTTTTSSTSTRALSRLPALYCYEDCLRRKVPPPSSSCPCPSCSSSSSNAISGQVGRARHFGYCCLSVQRQQHLCRRKQRKEWPNNLPPAHLANNGVKEKQRKKHSAAHCLNLNFKKSSITHIINLLQLLTSIILLTLPPQSSCHAMSAQAAPTVPSAEDPTDAQLALVHPRLAVFRTADEQRVSRPHSGDTAHHSDNGGDDDEDAIYEEVEYYLEEEERPPAATAATTPTRTATTDETDEQLLQHQRQLATTLARRLNATGGGGAAIGNVVEAEEEEDGDPVSDTQILATLLNRGYDWRVRPPGTNLSIPGDHGPVVVYVNMLIRSISKIDDVNMEYSAQLTFRETWVDGRLAYGLPRDGKPDHIILTAGQQIWMPDSFFQNEKMARKHEIDKPNVLIRVHKDGLILYSVRISLVLSCPMHLQYYPMDVQTCLIDLASYAYTDSDIEYRWKQQDPVQLKDGLESSLPSFQLTNVSTTSCTSKTNTGTYSCLRTVLTLKRQFSYYLLQLYIPSTMLVIVSWVSFWLDRTAVPARVTLGVTTLLTMTTQTSGINAKLPPVSYSKAIDIWCGACLAFIFSALLEFACVTYISSRMFYKRMRPSVAPSNGLSLSLGCTGVPKLTTARLVTSDGRPSICAHCRGLTPPPPPPPPSSAATASAMLAQLQHRPSLARTIHQQSNWDPEQPADEDYDDCEDVWVRRKDAAAPTNVAMMNCAHSPSTPPSLSTKIGGGTSPGAMVLMMPPAAVGEKAALLEQDLQLLRFNNNGSAAERQRYAERQRRGGANRNLCVDIIKRMPLARWICRRMEVEDPAKRADYVSRILFPLAFALFNLVYWLRYLKW